MHRHQEDHMMSFFAAVATFLFVVVIPALSIYLIIVY